MDIQDLHLDMLTLGTPKSRPGWYSGPAREDRDRVSFEMEGWQSLARFLLKAILRENQLGIGCVLSCGWRLFDHSSRTLFGL